MENECNKKAYLHLQWRHLFRAIASERSLGTRSLDGIHSRQPHRPALSLSAVDCWRNQRSPRWLRAISFHNLNPARSSSAFVGISRLVKIKFSLKPQLVWWDFVVMMNGDAMENGKCREKRFGKERLFGKSFFSSPFLRTNFRMKFTTPCSNLHCSASRNAPQSVYR